MTRRLRERLRPHLLIDELLTRYGFPKDAHLAEALDIDASIVSKIRGGILPVSAATMLLIHDVLGMPVKEIKALVMRQKEAEAARQRIAHKELADEAR